jgi:hypothetical protein
MFVRADQLLIEQTEDSFPLHVVDFHWDGFEPHMECRDLRSGEISEFDLHEVGFSVSRKKVCVGYFDDDGRYVPCPTGAAVSRFDQCPECATESFIPHQECIFEPRCDGELCDLEFCRREHVLYIAFYDTAMKIGMSSSRRVERRLIEQREDAFSIIGSFPSRKKAREAEKDISVRMRIPQSHRQDILLQSLVRPVDAEAIESRHRVLSASLEHSHHLIPEKLHFLDRYPINLPLAQAPRLQDSWGIHRGSFVGIKGRWLVYDSKGLKAVNLSDLPARFLSRPVRLTE